MFKLLVNKTRIHKVNDDVSWFRFVYTNTKQFQNQTGRIQNFPSAASLAEIFFSKRNNHE